MTMNQVAEASGIATSELQQVFGLADSEMDVPLKDAKASLSFSMNDVRTYVATRIGAPIPVPEDGEH